MARTALVTGGAGFIGSNLVNSLLGDGWNVTMFDAFSRRGSELNWTWLQQQSPNGHLRCVRGDVREYGSLRDAARDVDVIYHLAGQVAVTSSVDDPRTDFEINAQGTLNVLEMARRMRPHPVVVFTSTNKVYGGMEDVEVSQSATRYEYRDLPHGVAESRPLDFHSPYGCSKGAADQYVHDYARIYDLPTVVFRMSCIYGPRQFGTEDQGWLAHFMIAAATGSPITIYGDGKQVRDVLFVDDLVRALRAAADRIKITAGQVYNIGGGPSNTLSVWQEFGELLADCCGRRVAVNWGAWRPGDQPCYVSDVRKAGRDLEWHPAVNKYTGIHRLWEWISSNVETFRAVQAASGYPQLVTEGTIL